MEWVVGIQVDADACIFYVHMDPVHVKVEAQLARRGARQIYCAQ